VAAGIAASRIFSQKARAIAGEKGDELLALVGGDEVDAVVVVEVGGGDGDGVAV